MLMLLAALTLFCAAFLEASIRIDLHHFDSTQARIRVTLAGIHKTWLLQLVRTPQGHRLIMGDSSGVRPVGTGQLRQSRGALVADTLRRADKARRFLLSHLHLDRLDALALLHTGDAARSALLSGTLRSALACIPAARRRNVRIRVLPEFFREYSTLQARCIIRLRLGTIMVTAGMLFLAWLREQRLTESEAI